MERDLNRWLRRDGLALIAGWRRWGCDYAQVAKKMRVAVNRLKRWEKEHEDIAAALQVDYVAADFMVEEILFDKAIGGELKAVEMWMKKRARGNEEEKSEKGVDYMMLAEMISKVQN
ncbi:MAG: hypothetical protein FWE33_01780 [Defluviitaleaceae bacterium]|nr:hypothetical protein [Defluviitaleaceae bacterium]